MFRSPLELEVHARYRQELLAEERRRCAAIDRYDGTLTSPMTRARRRIGLGLIRLGAGIAGKEAPLGLPRWRAWAELAHG